MSMTYDEALEAIIRRIIREEVEKALKERPAVPHYVPLPYYPEPWRPVYPWWPTFTCTNKGTETK